VHDFPSIPAHANIPPGAKKHTEPMLSLPVDGHFVLPQQSSGTKAIFFWNLLPTRKSLQSQHTIKNYNIILYWH